MVIFICLKKRFYCLPKVTTEICSLERVPYVMLTRSFTRHHNLSECMEKKEKRNCTALTLTSQCICHCRSGTGVLSLSVSIKDTLATHKQKKGLGIPVLSLNKTDEKAKKK